MDSIDHYGKLMEKLKVVKDRVRGVVWGESNGMYLYGRPGTSKTHTVCSTLDTLAVNFTYNNGHLMVVPYEHVASQEQLATEALTDLMLTVNRCLAVLRKVYNPPAFNLGANLGAAAGAGIAEHYHFHIVPRWPGDASFMTVIGNTRVIPDSLENIYHDLKAGWAELYPPEGGTE